ncbi:MAG: DUF952 domain-containing protein [Anaerolineaceae bacterium]|nr:MAG: DUF952 domain-containing protein [Anaerolineaceae bacterium]
MKPILHITQKSAWETAQTNGFYSAPSLETEGFIHCSMPAQVVATAERFYAGQHGLVLLVIDASRIQAEVKFEAGTDKPDELFPHIYGTLNLDAVTRVLDFASDSTGKWTLPPL